MEPHMQLYALLTTPSIYNNAGKWQPDAGNGTSPIQISNIYNTVTTQVIIQTICCHLQLAEPFKWFCCGVLLFIVWKFPIYS